MKKDIEKLIKIYDKYITKDYKGDAKIQSILNGVSCDLKNILIRAKEQFNLPINKNK